MKPITPLLSAIFCLCVTCGAMAGQGKIYKWTDEKGQVHFGSQPPMSVKSELIKKAEPSDAPETASGGESLSNNAQSSNSASSTPSKPTFKDKDRCEAAKQNLEALKTFSRIKMKEDNGNVRYLTPEEQQQKVKESELAINQSCE